MVDANGVLVLLKFLNQDLSAIKFPPETAIFKEDSTNINKNLMSAVVKQMLKLLYSLCSKYPQRIKDFLVQYKAPLIMRKIHNKFPDEEIKHRTLKLIKIQVKYMPKRWRETNMRIVTAIYNKLKLSSKDDWLMFEGWNPNEEKGLTQDEIRNLNNEFNTKFYPLIGENGVLISSEDKDLLPIEKTATEKWIMKEYNKITLDEDFCKNYEKWLEENVFGYYD